METTKLYIALTSGNDEDALKQLQEPDEDLDLTARNPEGQTYLHLAGQKIKSIEVRFRYLYVCSPLYNKTV